MIMIHRNEPKRVRSYRWFTSVFPMVQAESIISAESVTQATILRVADQPSLTVWSIFYGC